MTNEHKAELEALCLRFRNDLIDLLHSIQTGHPGGSLSCCEIVTLLYQDIMNIDPADPEKKGRDHFIMSKGHAAPMLYLNLAEKGYFPKEWLPTLRQLNSNLQGHPCVHKTPGVELSAGPLGLGLGAGIGMAIADRMQGYDNYTYVLLGDGEIQEGAIWEAAMAGNKFKTDHVIAILDHNGVQLDGTVEEIMPEGDVSAKWAAFGWNVIEIDGHDFNQILGALDAAKACKGKPTAIIANTVKGKGFPFAEGKAAYHNAALSEEEYKLARELVKKMKEEA